MKKLWRVTEPDVYAEFLKNEFYRYEFHRDRESFERLVMQADIANESENAVRRALLFRRRGHMLRELPADTQWWEVNIEADDLDLLRVFPRAQWRQVASNSFLLKDIADRIRTGRFSARSRHFISKVQALSYSLCADQTRSCVLLIGIDEKSPFTILEGNHRITAALLVNQSMMLTRFRVMCGFSARMAESCWYETNLPNLWRYARNRMQNLLYDKDADVERALREAYKDFGNPLEDALSNRKVAPGSK